MNMIKELRPAFMLTLVFLVLCGLAYPWAVTGLAHVVAPEKAGGSIIEVGGKAVGSRIVGQAFTDARFMKGRPSAVNYNTYTLQEKQEGEYGGVASGSQNLAASNPALAERVKADMAAFLAANPEVKAQDIPADLLTASGSGLDPHISLAAARIQIPALAANSGLSKQQLEAIINSNTTAKALGVFGENVVNVLGVNLDIARALGLVKE